ncbi:MAG: tetratricopeptide repeat protein [Chloroflexota bacterium]|nr:tetratricopeptide repeat protein [Chloroflexota bacterium]
MVRHETFPELVSGGTHSLRIQLLGGFRVILDERVIGETEWRLRKAAGLFKLLALSPRHQLHRERALELLWPDLEPKVATNNFHRTLHVLRRILEPDRQSTWLRLQDDVLMLGPPGWVGVDVQDFELACRAARGASDPAPYYVALELYTGQLLPGDRYEDWAASRREELQGLYLSVLLDLARLHEARQDFPAAVEALRRVVEGEPSHEEAHTGLMRLYALSGQRHQALRQYGQLRDALLRELDAEPEAESERLYQEIRSGLYPQKVSHSLAPVGQNAPTPRHNLPVPLTSFIGREHEIVEVRRLLATTRLLTLIGTGGCGKTRLALEVARDPDDRYADEVWLVELAGLADPRLLPRAVAGVLGMREDPDRLLIDRLADALRSRQLLLVLDNCEHLLEACAELVDTLLSSSPGLRVLATSREALDAMGEQHWRVPSLSLPPVGVLPTVERAGEYEAVRLFVERARHRQPGFDLSAQEDMRAVVEICRQLDGIPLAIELATSRLPVLSVQQIAAKLDDSLRLLTRGGRTAVPRHRTLRGVLDWSYALLNEPERDLFARLSVFAGSWTLEAAEAVGLASVADGAGTEDGLELLSRLVDRSLVQVEAGHEGAVRYRLLEVVRQYARERLEASGTAATVHRQHVAFFLALGEAADPALIGPRQAIWLSRLEREHDNLRAALSWSLEEGEFESGARLAAPLWRFWWIHGHLSEGRQWFRQVLAAPDALSPPVRARALRGASLLARAQSAYEEATALVEQSLALFRELGDTDGIGHALSNLGTILACQGAYEQARAVEEEGLAISRQLHDKRGIAVSLDQLGQYSYYLGDYEAAARYWEESLQLNREIEDLHSLAITLNNLGEMARDRGELDRALDRFEEAVALFRRLDARTTLAYSLQSFADLRLKRQEYEQAQALLHESVLLLRELGSAQSIACCLETFAKLACIQGLSERAARLFGAAEGLRAASGTALSSAERASLQASIDAARSNLVEQAWSAAWLEGKAMSLERATDYALSTAESSPPCRTVSRGASTGEPIAVLTRREREIVGLLAQGLTNRQIAQQLVLSERTVDTHGVNIMRKLGLHSRAQVAAWAVQQGLLPES